jgi:hypothetical protein
MASGPGEKRAGKHLGSRDGHTREPASLAVGAAKPENRLHGSADAAVVAAAVTTSAVSTAAIHAAVVGARDAARSGRWTARLRMSGVRRLRPSLGNGRLPDFHCKPVTIAPLALYAPKAKTASQCGEVPSSATIDWSQGVVFLAFVSRTNGSIPCLVRPSSGYGVRFTNRTRGQLRLYRNRARLARVAANTLNL